MGRERFIDMEMLRDRLFTLSGFLQRFTKDAKNVLKECDLQNLRILPKCFW